MAYSTPTTAVAATAYSAADMNKIVNNQTWLYGQRCLGGLDIDANTWTITAGASTWEDDTAGTAVATVTLAVTSTVYVIANIIWSSDTARDTAVEFRAKCGASYGGAPGTWWGTPDVDCRQSATLIAQFTSVTAGSVSVSLSARRNNASDTITIRARAIQVLVFPE